jgi:hypothetical protein
VEDAVEVEEIRLTVRVFRQYVEPRSPEDPIDPVPFENTVESIYASLEDKQAHPSLIATGAWYLRPTSFEIDYLVQGVEVSVLVQRANPFTN